MKLVIRQSAASLSVALLQFSTIFQGTASESGLVTRQTLTTPDACISVCSGPNSVIETISQQCNDVLHVSSSAAFQAEMCLGMSCSRDFLDGIDNCIICGVENGALSQAAAKDAAAEWTKVRQTCISSGHPVDATSKADTGKSSSGGSTTSTTNTSNSNSNANSQGTNANGNSAVSGSSTTGSANAAVGSSNTNGNAASKPTSDSFKVGFPALLIVAAMTVAVMV